MKTILVVDDHASFRRPIEALLAARGHRTVGASDGKQALGLIVSEHPDLVLLDLRMPVMDGLTVLEQLRARADVGQTPVVVLSSSADRALIVRAARFGISGYIWKTGFSARALIDRVEQTLESNGTTGNQSLAEVGAAEQPGPAGGVTPEQRPSLSRGDQQPSQTVHGHSASPDRPVGQPGPRPPVSRSELLAKVALLEELAPFPPAVMHLLAITADQDCSLAQVATAAGHDPAIAIKVLRLANSAIYARNGRVTTVKQAVSRIGLQSIRQALLNLAVVDRFGAIGLKGRLEPGQFWEHCIACGLIASDLARASGDSRTDNAFACGLLHDVGRLALAEALGEQYADVLDTARELGTSVEQVEARVLRVDHAGLLEQLFGAWGCPRQILDPARFHHAQDSELQCLASPLAADALRLKLADRLAHALLIGNSGNETISPTSTLCRTLGVKASTLDAIQSTIQERTDEVRTSLLADSKGLAWQRRAVEVRNMLKVPAHPVLVGIASETDAYRLLCEQLTEPERSIPPNVAVVHIGAARERKELGELLHRAEHEAGNKPLPLLMLSPGGNLVLESASVGGRTWRALPTPTRVDSFVAALNVLLNAETKLEAA